MIPAQEVDIAVSSCRFIIHRFIFSRNVDVSDIVSCGNMLDRDLQTSRGLSLPTSLVRSDKTVLDYSVDG